VSWLAIVGLHGYVASGRKASEWFGKNVEVVAISNESSLNVELLHGCRRILRFAGKWSLMNHALIVSEAYSVAVLVFGPRKEYHGAPGCDGELLGI
jgi:hypothetical protein